MRRNKYDINRRLFFPVAVAIVWLSACNDCVCVDTDNVSIHFVQYEVADVDTVVIQKYPAESNFTRLVDSSWFDKSSFVLQQRGDTVSFPVRTSTLALVPGYDYIVTLPALQKEIRISGMQVADSRGSCAGKVQCVNGIVAVSVDGIKRQFSETRFDVYLSR